MMTQFKGIHLSQNMIYRKNPWNTYLPAAEKTPAAVRIAAANAVLPGLPVLRDPRGQWDLMVLPA
ncbi:hypothetical protein DWV84_13160 [Blautia sp. AF13-16]|jgi:hypothetical protein|uniref:Uncharacterized protein n=1 Tax=Blautia parvula TaxID=2877527 RepID=A0ABQ0BY68_9FIRM|nr:hypothetical protein DXA40_09510 [Blautia sp. OF01-4LB]RHS15339.1 hypothetical protein DWV84_13160 [Blautia sp. AF13-16]